jgi:hypothetical protein
MKNQKLKLTSGEADFICWEESFYKNNVRADNKRAARYAWKRAVEKFPRLAAFNAGMPNESSSPTAGGGKGGAERKP